MNTNLFEGTPTIYEPLPGVKNAVMTVIENIYDDEYYQASLMELEQTGDKGMKKVSMIKNAITELLIFGSTTQPLIRSRDIGILMNLSNVDSMVKNFKEGNERVTGFIRNNGKIKETVFLTRNGIYRASMAGHSKLSGVFREFLYKLIDHMIVNENEKLRDLIARFQSENSDMIRDSVIELNNNYHELKKLYAQEHAERIEFQRQAEREARARVRAEKDVEELHTEVLRSSEAIYILEQKLAEDVTYVENLIGQERSNQSIEQLLKKKFLKEMQVYLVDPDYLEKMLSKKKHGSNKKMTSPMSDSEDETPAAYSPGLITTKSYMKNYRRIYNLYTTYGVIDEAEVLMYKLSFGKTILKKKCAHVVTEYILDKATYAAIKDKLEAQYIDMPAGRVYQTSLCFIRECAAEHLRGDLAEDGAE